MSTTEPTPDEQLEGVSQLPGTATTEVTVVHPETGETQTIRVPADHDGSRIKVEFPGGGVAHTEGFDPAERAVAGQRPVVPCGNCGAPQTLTQETFDCSACGARNSIALRAATEEAAGASSEV